MSKIVFRIQQIIYDRDFQQKLLTKVVYYFKYIYQVYPVVTFSLRGVLTVKKITQMIYLKLHGFTLKGQKKFTPVTWEIVSLHNGADTKGII